MTLAVCIKCGGEKLGALTRCPGCGFDPCEDHVAQAQCLLLSDRHLDPGGLREIAAAIRSGNPPAFDQDKVEAMAAELARMPSPQMPLGCQVAVWTPIVVMMLLALFVAWLFLWVRP